MNLSYGEHVKNVGPDKIRDGTLIHGERHYATRLSAADVASIRQRRSNGEPCRALAREFGVQPSTISRIATGARWGRDGTPTLARPPRPIRRGVLAEADVAAIRDRYAAGGVSQYRLAAEYDVTQSYVSQIVTGIRRSSGHKDYQMA
jgi:DNA-binding transcriptional regulator YdaS (Cro superfamily)